MSVSSYSDQTAPSSENTTKHMVQWRKLVGLRSPLSPLELGI